jgi:hypothetical protein
MPKSMQTFLTASVPFIVLGLCAEVSAQATDVDCAKCVDAKDIAANAVTTYKLRDQAVTASKIAPEAITTNKIELQAVTKKQLATGAVTTAKIKDGAVTGRKLSSELANAIDANSASVSGLETEAADHAAAISQLQHDVDLVLDRVIPCGEYKLYGCTQSTSADGTVFLVNWFRGGTNNVAYYRDPSAVDNGDSLFFTIPTADQEDFENLWIGGSANLTRGLIRGNKASPVLVDNCENPTVELVRTGEPASSRLVVNSGNFYRAARDPNGPTQNSYGPVIDTVDVTGQMYGLINHQTPGDIMEPCTLVTDQSGLYDVYAIELKFNIFDGRFDGSWTHQ